MNFLRPVDRVYPITQVWGENPSWYPATNGHNGVDFGCPEGTPVYAAYDGTVTLADLDPATAANAKSGYGLQVRILHPNGWTSIYGHFSKIAVKPGQKVKTGEVIGLSGNTGFSTGPHLHFEVRTGKLIGTSVDPLPMIVNRVPSTSVLMTATVTSEGAGLRVRSGPGKEYAERRKLKAGDKFNVIGIAGEAWLMTDDGYSMYQAAWVDLEGLPTVVINKPVKKAVRIVRRAK